MKVAVCYLTNLTNINNLYNNTPNHIHQNLISTLNHSLFQKHEYDVYTLLDIKNKLENTVSNQNNERLIPFTFADLREKYNINRRYFKEHMGICHLPLFYLSDLYPEYDYYLFYEDDLYFTNFLYTHTDLGRLIHNPFNNIDFEKYDVTFMYNRKQNQEWFWVKHYEYNLPERWNAYEGLLNCYIISNKALNDLKDFCKDEIYYGHHELMVNSFFYNQQYRYNINTVDKYYKTYIEWREKDLLPVLEQIKEPIHNVFIHPVKNLNVLNGLTILS